MKNKTIDSQSFFRTFNANHTNDSFDIYVDEKLFNTDLLYKDFSVYTPITEGKHIVSLTLNGDSNIVTTREIFIKSHKIYTLIISINTKNLLSNLYFIEDIRKKIPNNCSLVRIGNFCLQKETLAFSFIDSTKSFKKVFSTAVTHYVSFLEGNFKMCSWYSQTHEHFIEDTELLFKPYRIYTIYIIGDGSSNYPFECVRSIDGSSFLSFIESP